MADFTDGIRKNSNDDDHFLPGELAEAYLTFHELPPSHRLTYLLYLLGMKPHLLAPIQGSDEETVKEQLAEAEAILLDRIERLVEIELNALGDSGSHVPDSEETGNPIRRLINLIPPEVRAVYRLVKKYGSVPKAAEELGISWTEAMDRIESLKPLFQRQIESMMRRLLEIDASSPPPLNELAELIAEAKSLRSFVVDCDEVLESETVPLRTAPEMTHAECAEADRVLFNLPLSIREVFALHHFAGLDEREIANVLRITDSDVGRLLFLGRAIMSQLMEGLVVGMLQWKAATPEKRRSEEFRMSRTERNTARSTWRLLPDECRSCVRWHLFHGLSVQEIVEKTGFDMEFVDGMIEFTREQLVLRMETLVTAWLRSNLPPDAATETILQKLQADSFIKEESAPAPKRPLSIGEAEISFAETTLYEIEVFEREAFELFAVKCNPEKIASILKMGPEEVREHLRSARQQLGDRLERLVTALMQRRMRLHAPKLDGDETAAAKIVFKTIPKSCQKPFILFMATGFSVEEIAETLGLFPYQVQQRISKAKKAIRIRAIQAAIAWVRQDEEIKTARERVLTFHKMISLLREIPEREASTTVPSESESDFSYIKAELDEIETTIARLDFEIREAFVLGFGAGLDPSEIATIQKTDEKETFRRLKEGIETVRDQVVRLIVAWLRKRMKSPNAPRLKPTEGLTAKQAYMEIPEECREAFVRFRVKGESAQEIAAAFQVYTGKVEDWLEKAEQAITGRALQLAAQALDQIRGGRPVGEILLGNSKQIRFPSSVWQNTSIGIPAESVPSETPIINTPPKNLAYDVIPSKETQAEKSRNVMAFFSGIGVGMSQMGETVKTVLASIWATGFMVLAAPFLWVMSVLISGQVSGFAFIRTAPTLDARRWLTAKLFYIYSLLFAGPLGLVIVASKLGLKNHIQQQILVSTYLLLLACFLFILIIQTASKYKKLYVQQDINHVQKRDFKKLHLIINFGFTFHTLIYSQLIWGIAQDISPILYRETIGLWMIRMLILTGLVGLIHAAAYFMFRYFLRISKDETAFQENPPIKISESNDTVGRRIYEFLRLLPFAIFPLLANILHITVAREHILRSSIELIVYTMWWSIVWRINTRKDERKLLRILISFAAQFIIMKILRDMYP